MEEILCCIKEIKVIKKATNGEEALFKVEEFVEKEHKCFDIILMDINMPIMDGF